jgi:amidophosphoribosyltransferase
MGIVIVHHTDHERNCLGDIYWGLYNINHTGQECCGVTLYDGEELAHDSYEGLVRAYKPSPGLKGYSGVGSTGDSMDHQPKIFESPKLGEFALAFDGYIVNAEDLRHKTGELFSSRDHVELAARLIGKGRTFPDGISILSKEAVGPFCVGIITEEGDVYAARCPMATRPLALGEGDGKFGAVTESRGFGNIHMNLTRDVKAGEVVKIDDFGFHTVKQIEGKPRKVCSFLHGYFSWVDCVIEDIPVNAARERVGALMAEKDKGLEIDVVCGVPDSGKAYAEGYAGEKGCRYSELLIKWAYALRSYTRPTQEERDLEADAKISAVRSRIEGKRVVLFDDSIRRGTQLRKRPLKYLKENGAKEIHLRIGSPRNTAYCRFAPREAGDETLLANQLETDRKVAEFLGVDSVRFPTVDEFVEAIVRGTDLTADDLCLGCYEGDFGFTGMDL